MQSSKNNIQMNTNEQMMNEKKNVKMNENLYKHHGRMVLPDEKYIHRPQNLFIPIFLF